MSRCACQPLLHYISMVAGGTHYLGVSTKQASCFAEWSIFSCMDERGIYLRKDACCLPDISHCLSMYS